MDTEAVKMEVDEESVANFVTTNIISHDSMVTCGNCKEVFTYQEYDSKHRDVHYDLCWLDGVEDEIDFTNIPKIKTILRKRISKPETKLQFVCQWCGGIYISVAGFATHLSRCKKNCLLKVSDSSLNQSQIDQNKTNDLSIDKSINDTPNDDCIVLCGYCGENMNYAEYMKNHRYKHNNLCWLDGEEKLDYLNENKIASLLRAILPKHAERDKKVSFVCEWCTTNKKSVVGFASHVKKCAIEKKLVTLQCNLPQLMEEETNSKSDSEYHSEDIVTCGRCDKSMPYKEYKKDHKLRHYNLCWIDENEKLDFDDEIVLQRLLRKSLPKDAIIKKKVKFICEWCQTIKKSVQGFASHIKQCQSRPDKLVSYNENELLYSTITSDREIFERDSSVVTCGRCNKQMTYKEYHLKHCPSHYNLCWIDGEDKLDLGNYDSVLSKLRQFIPFKVVRSRGVNLTCEDCKSVKKSLVGFASHVIFCNKSANDIETLLITCEDCLSQIKPASLVGHKLKNCKMSRNSDNIVPYRSRRKKRPPNVLSFHPDTKYVTEYYDFVCRLCNFISLSINTIINHILNVHDIDINKIESEDNLENYISNEYDAQKNIYLKPLLNYYNYFRKMFWKTNCHEDFHSDLFVLNQNEALKYLPSVQQSCKIFNSDNEQISVDLFKSVYVNGMYWLFTGGPNWAMAWCPVPEEIQIQYLAIACHPKPDLEHKEMDSYKYPSIVQLWTFNSLNNVNYESITVPDMPFMSYGLAHEFGAVWDMAWCPSGAYGPPNKIGILALSTSCGDCPIFAMPCVEGNQEVYYLYKSKPVIARNFECEWIKGGVQCTKVCWQVVSPFRTLICGYSNGVVSVFNLNFKSIFFNDDILYPSHTFRASRSSITGLSMNYFNSSILATTATDGYVLLWDLKMTENPIFQKKSYSPSDCTWLQQCYTLVYCSKGVNPAFLKVRTVNFSNYDIDGSDYIPELYVLNNVQNSNKVIISNYNIVNNKNKSNSNTNEDKISVNNESTILNDSNMMNCVDADNTFNEENKINMNNDSNMNSDNESDKYNESILSSDEEFKIEGEEENTSKPGDVPKIIEEEDFYGPSYFQGGTHWTVSGSNWMNVIATGDENGYIYETLFLPETNNLKITNSTTLQLIVRQLSNEKSQSEFLNGYRFNDTVKEFSLESQFFSFHKKAKDDKNKSKSLLRYPLDNITKISWNQNFSSFRWMASGTQSGFTLVSQSKTISDSYFQSFYKIISTDFNSCN